MKIADCKTYVVANPPPHHGGAYFVFLKLTTDDNIEGFGRRQRRCWSNGVSQVDRRDTHSIGPSNLSNQPGINSCAQGDTRER